MTRRLPLWVLPLFALLLAPRLAAAQSGQIWLVSTRCAPACGAPDPTAIGYWFLDAQQQWVAADRAALLATDNPAAPTVLFVHGNRTDADEAISRAMLLYRQLECDAAGRPFRFVIWSWPSEKACRGLRADAQLKASYSDAEAYYLGEFLSHVRSDAPVSLVGFSFGARVITGGLHLLAGGDVAGYALAEPIAVQKDQAKRVPYRAVLVAAAMDADWLAPGHCHGRALMLVDRMLITENCQDRVVRWYSRLYGRGGPEALGYAGPVGCCAAECEKIELVDISCTVGKRHDWTLYVAAPGLQARLGWYAHFEDR